jgi:histone H3/H4
MVAMDALCHDLFERICQEAGRVARYSKHQTLSSKDIQVATKLILRGELANHAVSAGIQSIVRYNGSESSN